MINIVHVVRLYIEMFDFMASVVHPSEVPDVNDYIHSTQLGEKNKNYYKI